MTNWQEAAPTVEEIRNETNPTRRSILAAMTRLLSCQPTTVKPGQISVAALAREAGIDRAKLTTGAHKDLGERLLALKEASQQPSTPQELALSDRVRMLAAQLAELDRKHRQAISERNDWRKRYEVLAHQAATLSRENARLSEHALRARGGTRSLAVVPVPSDQVDNSPPINKRPGTRRRNQ